MKNHALAQIAAFLLLPLTLHAQRVTENFDADWKFFPGDASGAEQITFADAAWQKLTVPHDWSIAGPFAQTNLTGGAGGFLPSGVVWYRKHFPLPKDFPNANYAVEFDGVMANSDVWINGFHLGHRPNGYVSFSYNLTGHLHFGGDNVLAVRCDTSAQPASRWYTGGGIYRHVRLVHTTHLFVPPNGCFVSTPQVATGEATVHAEVVVTNNNSVPQSVFLQLTVHDAAGKIVSTAQTPLQTVPDADSITFRTDLVVAKPQLWTLTQPSLYQLQVEVCGPPAEPDSPRAKMISETNRIGSKSDVVTVTFGIRDAHFEANTGFWLNGENFKLNGVCLHADGGAFGAAIPLSIWETRLTALKSLGVNALRTAHNPPAPEFLDLCDRMGFLVMDEFFDCWTRGKNVSDYHLFFSEWAHTDEHDSILRDRNHPSVIIYSVGNEILDTPNAEKAKKILAGLVAVAHAADPTRPVTQALFRPNVSGDYTNGLADLLDVVGQNYREQEILAAHEQKPTRKILGTENKHDREQWVAVRDNPPYAGQFLWTGVDYLGESKHWPTVGYGSGLLDRTGAIRPRARERESWWATAPMVSVNRRVSPNDLLPTDPGYGGEEKHTQVVFADWTPHNREPHDVNVEVYSNCKTVELFLNGQSLGVQNLKADARPRNWTVSFAPGILRAVARNEGKIVATNELRTAGKPAKIILSPETKTLLPGFDSVAVIRAKITDAAGIEIPDAHDLISFQISGPGRVAAVDNGDNASPELFQTNSRPAYQGECVAFVKTTATTGKITVRATANGLASGVCSVKIAR